MSVKHIVVVALLASACRDKAAPPAAKAGVSAAPAALDSRIAQAKPPTPKLPPPPPEQRAQVVLTAPSPGKLLPDCDDVKVRIYAGGERRSCMTGSAEGGPDVFASCGLRAELPADTPIRLEVRYERRGVLLASMDLGEQTLDVGQQTLAARGHVTYGDVERLCRTP